MKITAKEKVLILKHRIKATGNPLEEFNKKIVFVGVYNNKGLSVNMKGKCLIYGNELFIKSKNDFIKLSHYLNKYDIDIKEGSAILLSKDKEQRIDIALN